MQALRTLTDWLEVWCKWMPVTGISWCVSLIIGSVVAQVAGLALPGAARLAMGGLVAVGPRPRAGGEGGLAVDDRCRLDVRDGPGYEPTRSHRNGPDRRQDGSDRH